MKSKKTSNEIDGINITDKKIKYVLLNSGTYKIDGQIINVDGYYSKEKVGVKDFTDIRIVDTTTFVEKYVCGTEFKTVEEYEKEREFLLSKRILKYGDEYSWETLDDEFNYRRFTELWTPIEKTIQTISEPIEVEIKKVKTESGNKFISSCFLNDTDEDLTLFTYNRPSAVKNIVTECFTELGMVYEDNKSYGATEGKKIWSNSTHSCIRYVAAFGTYIFGDSWDIRYSPKGKINDLLKQYEEDKKTLRNIIITKYNNHFGRIEQGSFDFKSLLNKLNQALNSLDKVDPKKNTYDYKRIGINNLREAKTMIETAYKCE
jgi:hypothetical protein